MAISPLHEVVECLRRTVFLQDGAGLTDGQLLDRFIEQSDDAALAALMRRHGPLVWRICRRILGDHHDAEDAFQATFLVLVRRAASVVPREMVASWLYGVASQTARKAKATTAKRRMRESHPVQLPEPAGEEPDRDDDLHHRLHQALAGLPDKFRASLILCYLEEKTRTEAARLLGVPEGTLASWLARGRAMLAKRLARQGLILSAGTLIAALGQSTTSASVPVSLVSTTLQAASCLIRGQALAGVVSTRVVALMEGVIKGMLATKIKITTTVVLALIVAVGLGSGSLAFRMQAAEREISVQTSLPEEPQASAPNEAPPEKAKSVTVNNDGDDEPLVGSGKEGKKEIKVADFDALRIRLPVQASVKQGKTYSVVITGDDNLLDMVKADKEGTTLQFSANRRSWRTSKPLKVTITMPSLGRAHLDSASRLTIQDFKSNKDFSLKMSGASRVEGSIEAGIFKLDSSGASTLKLQGVAKKATLAATGASTLQLGEFALDSADVKLSGASRATINAKTKLDYSLSGASSLRYQGDPQIGQKQLTGASSVRRGKR